MSMITAKELASLLNGREHGSEITKEETLLAKASGLVVVYGASDYLMEFRGAINDELEAYEGTTARLNKDGLLFSPNENDRSFCAEKCKYFKEEINNARTIQATWWEEEGISWQYKTDIPHETFDIMDGGELYCRGIVFSIGGLCHKQTMPEEPFKLTPDEIKRIEDAVNKSLGDGISFCNNSVDVRDIELDDECTMVLILDIVNHNPCYAELGNEEEDND